jgi:ribonuclease III
MIVSAERERPDQADAEARMRRAEAVLGVTFSDRDLLRTALTHPSYSFEAGSREQYERLEFLGDAVLGFIVTDHLYRTFPDAPEGRMAKLRSAIVSGRQLASIASELGLGEAVLVGHGAEVTGARRLTSLLADAFEALIGAVYLDRGLDVVREFVMGVLVPRVLPEALSGAFADTKSELQERTMAHGGPTPVYRIVAEEGPPHERVFTAEVSLGDRVLGTGRGPSKREAEKTAAAEALITLDADPE